MLCGYLHKRTLVSLPQEILRIFSQFHVILNSMKTLPIILILLAVLVFVGYAGYTYVKQDPPDALIEVITSQEPAPLLPEGELAPLQTQDDFSAT